MAVFPSDPVSPRVFVEEVIPALFAEAATPETAPDGTPIDIKVGLSLRGDEGGDWTLHFARADLRVAEGIADDCKLTLVQSVEDWRAALWEGRAPGLLARAVTVLVVAFSVLGPMLVFGSGSRSIGAWARDVGNANTELIHGGTLALAVFIPGVLVATGIAMGLARGGVSRLLSTVCVVAFAALALIPGVLVGDAFATVARTPMFSELSYTPLPLMFAVFARCAFVCALGGWWIASSEPRDLRESRLQYAGRSAIGWWRTRGLACLPILVGVALASAMLALHEIEAAVMVEPPGWATLAGFMLRLLHYLRDEQLAAVALAMMLPGVAIALGATAWRFGVGRRGPAAAIVSLVCLVSLIGCEPISESDGQAFTPTLVFGEVGKEPGLFVKPRAIDVRDGTIWIIDKTARVQRFDAQGVHQASWHLPEFDQGMPVGCSISPDGSRLYIADTHENRVLIADAFSPEREVIDTVGRFGDEIGEFVYPTDIAWIPARGGRGERIAVGEYGGNDRVQLFDSEWRPISAFGREGSPLDGGEIVFRDRRPCCTMGPGMSSMSRTPTTTGSADSHPTAISSRGSEPPTGSRARRPARSKRPSASRCCPTVTSWSVNRETRACSGSTRKPAGASASSDFQAASPVRCTRPGAWRPTAGMSTSSTRATHACSDSGPERNNRPW